LENLTIHTAFTTIFSSLPKDEVRIKISYKQQIPSEHAEAGEVKAISLTFFDTEFRRTGQESLAPDPEQYANGLEETMLVYGRDKGSPRLDFS